MMPQSTKMLIGAVIAAVLAIAVYYGAISQQSANSIQGQANQALGTAPASQQTGAPSARSTAQAPAPVPQPSQTPH